jgi:hypothetical protein
MMGVVHLATARPASRKRCVTLQLRWKRYSRLNYLWSQTLLTVLLFPNAYDPAIARQMYDPGPCRVQNGYTLFTPWFKVRKCAFDADSTECKTNCIKKGRYCSADSIGDKFKTKYQGAQVWDETFVGYVIGVIAMKEPDLGIPSPCI